MQDALNRRSRFSRPQPGAKRTLILHDNDLKVFLAIARHGRLPSNYLYHFVETKDRNAFTDRLTALYNGYLTRDGRLISYLDRDPAQFDNYFARNNHLVYHLTSHAQKLVPGAPRRYDAFLHQLFGACFSASVALQCAGHIDKAQIFARINKPINLTLPISTGALTPDDLFGIRYPDGKARFYAVEIDRNTESIRSQVKSSIAHKVAGYEEILAHGAFNEHWRIPNLTILFATTGGAHLRNMLAYVNDRQFAHKFLFKAFDNFGENWRVPKALLPVFEPWRSTRGEVDISKRATV